MVGLPSTVKAFWKHRTDRVSCVSPRQFTLHQGESADQLLCMSVLGWKPLRSQGASALQLQFILIVPPQCSIDYWNRVVPASNLTVSSCKWWLTGAWDLQGKEMSWHHLLGRTRGSFYLHVPISINCAAQGQDLIDVPWNNVHLCPLYSLPNLRLLWCKEIIYLFWYWSLNQLDAFL